jgi:hypothetical protein
MLFQQVFKTSHCHYEWYFTPVGGNRVQIAGASGASYTVNVTTTNCNALFGKYEVRAKNAYGEVKSEANLSAAGTSCNS